MNAEKENLNNLKNDSRSVSQLDLQTGVQHLISYHVCVSSRAATTWWSISGSLKLSRGGSGTSNSSEQLTCSRRYCARKSRKSQWIKLPVQPLK